MAFYKNDKDFVIARICKAWAGKFVAIHKFSVAFALWIATLALLARNDGQRKRILSFYNDGELLSFWAFDRKRKIHLQRRQDIVILSEWNERKIQRI